MTKIFFMIILSLQIAISYVIDDNFEIFSDTDEKGTSLTSINNNLYLISTSKKYNIINKNYNSINNNKDNAQILSQFNNDFEIVETSINKVTRESIILIAENDNIRNKINLYTFNITAPLKDNNNPKLIHSISVEISNSKISLIKLGNDKYLLSYIVKENKFENLVFKYTSYQGFVILKKFEKNENVNNFISCFLLYEQFPICYYSNKITPAMISYQKIIALDTIFNNNVNRYSELQFVENNGNDCYFNKAIYLSNDYAVFCYIVDNNNQIICYIRKIKIEFDNFVISIEDTISINININYSTDLKIFDLIKVDDNKFLCGSIDNANKPILYLYTLDNTFHPSTSDIIEINNVNSKTTLTLFTHNLSSNNNFFGIIFNDLSENKLKYGYLNLPKCTPKSNIFLINFDNENKFKLSDYLDISIENEYSTLSFTDYIIISFISNDENNIFNFKIFKSISASEIEINIGDIVSKDDELIIKPKIEQVFNSGNFYIEVAPINSNIQGKSCKFEFDSICYEGCRACKEYDETATEISNHKCLSCRSNYYSLNDLCLTECSLIPGYHDVFQTKECIFEPLEFINDCSYKIWYIDQDNDKNICSHSNFCPQNIPYTYKSTGECIEKCRYSELVQADCFISNILGAKEDFMQTIKSEISSLGDDVFEKNELIRINKSIVIFGNNITIEISDTAKIKNDINFNYLVSDINITDCGLKLKNTLNTPDDKELIIVKIDLRRNDTIASQIEYILYDPEPSPTKESLDLSSCNNVITQSPIYVNESYSNKIKEIYKEGYDIFKLEEKFYSDLCVPFYDKKLEADLTLEKRQIVYYYINANLCEEKCQYVGFNIKTFKAICNCPIKKNIDLDISKKGIFNYIEENEQKIYYKETISNLKSVKCFKYIFSKKGFSYNWGSYFMMLMIIGFAIFSVIWFVKGETFILLYIREILDKIIIKNEDVYQEKVKKKFEEMRNTNKNKEKEEKINGGILPQKIEEKGKNENNPNNSQIENENDKDIIMSENKLIEKEKEVFRKKGPKKNVVSQRSISIKKENMLKEDVLIPKKLKIYSDKLSDIEIDLLTYDNAKVIDKREFSGYYWSILKYRQLIIFTFFTYDDYNFAFIKIIAFFLLLSLNFAYNAIFFFDEIINEIYDNEGKYSLKLQILNIFISSVAFSFTIILVRFIITCHKKYIKLKEIDNYEEAQKESYSIHKRLVIRYIIFIVVGSILILAIFYFITGFCAIFHYTQDHLFLNAFMSFLFSTIYSFAYCLLPAMFRYYGLKKDKKCCYCLSQYI